MSKRTRVHGHRRRRRLTVTFNIHRTNSRSILTRLCHRAHQYTRRYALQRIIDVEVLSCHFFLRRLGTPRATRIRPSVSPVAALPRSRASGRITSPRSRAPSARRRARRDAFARRVCEKASRTRFAGGTVARVLRRARDAQASSRATRA